MISLASRLYWRRFLRRNASAWTDLDVFPACDPARQRRELARRLLDQIRYFGGRADALPEWREAARITDPDELWRVWTGLPVLTKRMLCDCFPAQEMRDRFGLQGRISSTGGSTGEPLRFFHDTAMIRTILARDVYTRLRMGWRFGMPVITVWGSERDIGRETGSRRSRTTAKLLRTYLVDGYQLSQTTVDRVVHLVRAHAPVALNGFTSMLEFVARAVVEQRIPLLPGSVCVAWNGGETLFPEQGRIFQQAFGAPLLNRYGGRELSTLACQFEVGGPLQVLRPWLFLEVLRDDGRPADPGESGRLVWTSTVCRGTPFLRYDMEDLGVFASAHQSESGIAALDQLHGRQSGILQLPDGRVVSNLYWNHLFKEFAEVRQFQVVLKRNGEIWISLVGNGLTEAREAELRRTMSHLLKATPVKLIWTEQIPRTTQGKLVQVLREADPAANRVQSTTDGHKMY